MIDLCYLIHARMRLIFSRVWRGFCEPACSDLVYTCLFQMVNFVPIYMRSNQTATVRWHVAIARLFLIVAKFSIIWRY